MTLTYGVNISVGASIGGSPTKLDAELPFLVFAHPVDDTVGSSKTLKKINSYDDFETYYGTASYWGTNGLLRSSGWNGYKTAKLWLSNYNVYPIICYNVYDKTAHDTSVAGETLTFVTGIGETQYVANINADASTLVVTGKVLGTDYSVTRDLTTGKLGVTSITIGAGAQNVDYDYCDASNITKQNKLDGIDKINDILYTDGFGPQELPGIIHAPMWTYNDSDKADLRLQVKARANGYDNGIYKAKGFYDLVEDGTTATALADKDVVDPYMIACCGGGTFGSETEHLLSDHYIALQMLETESQGRGFPSVSAANRLIGSGSYEPTYKYTVANSNTLVAGGAITVCADRSGRGWVTWGSWTSYFAGTETDYSKDHYVQMAANVYLTKLIVNDTWSLSTYRTLTKQRVESIVERWNTYIKSLVDQNLLLGGELQFNEADNPDLTAQTTFRLVLLAPPTMARTDFIIQADLSYLSSIFPSA